jgi:sugar O-acyltransferase (sialic acid O-acetyltransferase NeuD family)
MRIRAVFGASGCGRGIIPLARSAFRSDKNCRLVFVDDGLAGTRVNGHDVLSFAEFKVLPVEDKAIAIAIADPEIRARLVQQCDDAGLGYFSVCAESVVSMDDVQLGQGALISPFVTLTSNIRIGAHFHANLYSYVEHDCVIGDYVTFAPGVRCNGNVEIGDGVYVGSGAIVKQGSASRPLRIGKGAVIGMGAVVLRDVEPGETVVGNPARPIKR